MAEIRGEVMKGKKAKEAARKAVPRPERKGSETAAGTGTSGEEQERESTPAPAVATEEPEKKSGNGLKRLQKAADRRLARASETLADLLLEKAQEGKLDSARLLVSLAERRQDRKDRKPQKPKKREGPSWAELLASEPEWEEEKPEVGDVWVGDGWKKQSTGEIVKSGWG